MIATWHDLSVLGNLEVDIQKRDQFLTTIMRSPADAIFTLDQQEHTTPWNKSAEDIFGYAEQEMLGQSLEILIPPGS